MRISTSSFFELNQAAMGAQQQQLFRAQQKLAAGTKFLTPSDDPVAAARALGVSQTLAESSQYASGRDRAVLSLSHEENALQSVTSILQDVKTLVVQAGNGTLSDADRAALATTLQSRLDQLVAVANSDDGNGQFLFAGYKSGSAPFAAQANGGVQYMGDQGQRLIQVDGARQMPSADDGRTVFQSVQGGAGYVTLAATGNTGSGVFGAVGVTDATAQDYGKDFVINFAGGNYTVALQDNPSVPVVGPVLFAADKPISFGGLQISISGTPADGDSFQVTTAKNAGTDVFAALGDLIGTLKKPLTGGGPAAQAQLLNALSTANVKITNAHDNVLTVRSSIGSRLNELDALDTGSASRDLTNKSYLSEIEDLDLASAISDYYQREASLKATQSTFARLSSIALFNYL
jgi:flagellar hook-associated protein 3 FlgL